MDFSEFKRVYMKLPVHEYPNEVVSEPLVSVCIQTYNHAQYIKECLDGVLMQKTSFPFEILLGEDESSDETREICIKYAEEYPAIVRLFLHTRVNNIRINGTPTGRFNSRYNLYSARGKYLAMCEGDDYWIDPYKLQKQVDFLESYPDYTLIHSDYNYKNQETGSIVEALYENKGKVFREEEDCAPLIISDKYDIATCTVVYQRVLGQSILENFAHDFDERYSMADYQMWFHLARLGKFKYLPDVTATYRRNYGSATAFFDYKKRREFIKNVYWQRRSFAERYDYLEVVPTIDFQYLRNLAFLTYRINGNNNNNEYYKKFKKLNNVSYISLMNLWGSFLKYRLKKIFKRNNN
ncbi:MAG: glycosyltransferase [Balneola sp.]